MKALCSSELYKNGNSDDFSNSFMYLVHQMHFLTHKHLEHVLSKASSLTFSQFMVLVGFQCTQDGPVSQTVIASQLDLTEATVSRHIAALVKLGFVTRVEDAKNRRKHVLTMTPKGKVAFAKTKEIIDTELTNLFSVINKTDQNNIMKNFQSVVSTLLTKK